MIGHGTDEASIDADVEANWDRRYEWRAVTLLTIAFGLVGLDRFVVNPLFPAMMKDLGLGYQDLGRSAAVLSLAWGGAAIVMGRVADRQGHRAVLIPAVLVFSLMAGFTGLVGGIGGLLAMRALMGAAEGAFLPVSVAATIAAARPSRRGLLFGIQQNGLALVGLGAGPIVATQLLALTGSWRLVFALVALPGVITAWLCYMVIRDRGGRIDTQAAAAPPRAVGYRELLRNRNLLCAILVMVCIIGALNMLIVMTPSYLVDGVGFPTATMGFIVASFGIGGVAGNIVLPALSDRFGRRRTMTIAAIGASVATGLCLILPPQPILYFAALAAVATFGFAIIVINGGPLTAESVPAGSATTAVGMVGGIGEIVGGFAPALAGSVAERFGLHHIFTLALAGMVGVLILTLFIREPPRLAPGA